MEERIEAANSGKGSMRGQETEEMEEHVASPGRFKFDFLEKEATLSLEEETSQEL